MSNSSAGLSGSLSRLSPEWLKQVVSKLNGIYDEPDAPIVALNGNLYIHDDFLPANDFIAIQRWAYGAPCEEAAQGEILISQQWNSKDGDSLPAEAVRFIAALRDAGLLADGEQATLQISRLPQHTDMDIPNDDATKRNIVFCFNDTWDTNWGGDFIIYKSAESRTLGSGISVLPLANRLISSNSNCYRKVTSTSNLALGRVLLQLTVQ
jgi:hypothetical protein